MTWKNIIGIFVNTLALRNYPSADKSFPRFLEEIRQNTFDCFENQEYQFEDLVGELNLTRDTGRNPLFDAMLMLQNIETDSHPEPAAPLDGLNIKPYGYETRISKFDLTLFVRGVDNRLACYFEYSTSLFNESTILLFIDYFKEIVSSVVATHSGTIGELVGMPADRQQNAIMRMNSQLTDEVETIDHRVSTLQDRLAESFSRPGERIVIRYQGESVSYEQLDRWSRRDSSMADKKTFIETRRLCGCNDGKPLCIHPGHACSFENQVCFCAPRFRISPAAA